MRSNLILCRVVLLLNFIFPRVMSNKLYCCGESQSKLVRFPFVLICDNFLLLLTLTVAVHKYTFKLLIYPCHCIVFFHFWIPSIHHWWNEMNTPWKCPFREKIYCNWYIQCVDSKLNLFQQNDYCISSIEFFNWWHINHLLFHFVRMNFIISTEYLQTNSKNIFENEIFCIKVKLFWQP